MRFFLTIIRVSLICLSFYSLDAFSAEIATGELTSTEVNLMQRNNGFHMQNTYDLTSGRQREPLAQYGC